MTISGKETVVSSERPFSGKLLKVRVDEVILPNGRRSKREIVEHRGAVAVVALIDGCVLLERQYRHTSGKVMWEIPAGTLEEGESAAEAAVRELQEETGYAIGKLVELAHFYVAVGYSTEVIWLFMADGPEKKTAHQDDDEHIEAVLVPLRDAIEMVLSNSIEDAKTIIGLLLAEKRAGGL